jgi:hypothetical protein
MGGDEVAGAFSALSLVGTVHAVRQEYRVYRTAGGSYVVMSPSSRGSAAYHLALVGKQKVEALDRIIGESATSGSLMGDRRVAEAFGEGDKDVRRFDLLMALYVLSALGKVELRRTGRVLEFSRRRTGR